MKITYIAIEINIFRVTAGCNGGGGRYTGVYAIDRPERININLQTGQCFI
jgi:hypothetical protein